MTRDEITAVREVRPATEPDAKAKAKARARLYAEFGRAPAAAPTRAPRTWWRPGVVWPVATTAGVAATCLVVGLVVVQADPDGDDTGRPGVVTTEGSGRAGVDATTARTMELAARTVEKQPFTEPKPHDWLYWKLVQGEKKDTWEEWRRFDGKKGAFYENGQLMRVPEGSEKDSPRASYEFFASLPDDPAKAREQIYRASKRLQGKGWSDADSKAFQYVLELFENTTMMPPDARATLFRAIATIPGVRIERDVVDAAGRHGIGVSRSDGRDRRVLLLDDHYGYLGEQLIAERTYTDPPVPIPAFTTTMPAKVTKKGITSDVALVELTIVDGPGKRP